jgi:hypothetical protein
MARQRTRRRYRDRTAVFLIAAIAYVVFANVSGPLGKNRIELFPFFNWSLFTNFSAGVRFDFAVYIEALDGRKLPQPTLVYELKRRLPRVGTGIDLAKATRALARNLLDKDAVRAERARKTVERVYLRGAGQVTYTVRLIRYSPIERYRTGKVTPLKTLARYETDRRG